MRRESLWDKLRYRFRHDPAGVLLDVHASHLQHRTMQALTRALMAEGNLGRGTAAQQLRALTELTNAQAEKIDLMSAQMEKIDSLEESVASTQRRLSEVEAELREARNALSCGRDWRPKSTSQPPAELPPPPPPFLPSLPPPSQQTAMAAAPPGSSSLARPAMPSECDFAAQKTLSPLASVGRPSPTAPGSEFTLPASSSLPWMGAPTPPIGRHVMPTGAEVPCAFSSACVQGVVDRECHGATAVLPHQPSCGGAGARSAAIDPAPLVPPPVDVPHSPLHMQNAARQRVAATRPSLSPSKHSVSPSSSSSTLQNSWRERAAICGCSMVGQSASRDKASPQARVGLRAMSAVRADVEGALSTPYQATLHPSSLLSNADLVQYYTQVCRTPESPQTL